MWRQARDGGVGRGGTVSLSHSLELQGAIFCLNWKHFIEYRQLDSKCYQLKNPNAGVPGRFTLLRAAGAAMWLPLMWQYLAHMASVPPDPQHNHCIGFPSWCPLCIHGSPNASIRFLVNGFIYMEKCPPPPGVWTSRLESLPALPFALSCMWMEALVDCDLTSLFVRSHSLVGWIWPWDSSPS